MRKPKTRVIERTSPEKRKRLQAILKELPGVSVGQQRARLLVALQTFPVTTYEAMRILDCYDPRRRIKDLRDRDGHSIVLHWVRIETEAGVAHRVGQYALIPKGAA
jgi:hypothetical protein